MKEAGRRAVETGMKPDPQRSSWALVILPLVLNALLLAVSLPLLALPEGARIRPLGWAFAVLLITLMGWGTGLVALDEMRRRRSWVRPLPALLLCLLPLPLAAGILHFKGLVLAH